MPQEKPPEEFNVVDRRRFSETGERRTDVPDQPLAAKPGPGPAPPKPTSAPPRQEASKAQAPPSQQSAAAQQVATSYRASGIGLRKVGFDRIVVMYYQTAMLQLGLLATEPGQPPLPPDPEGARETIDALALIEEKTRGNLTPEEQRMIENALFELRMAWLEIERHSMKAK